MTDNRQVATLQCFRTEREDMMEESVRCAIASLQAEGKTPSFYKVAERAQIARSSLYRKHNLRRLVEAARAGHGIGGHAAREYEELARENENLKREIHALRKELQLTRGIEVLSREAEHSSDITYCTIDFPMAA